MIGFFNVLKPVGYSSGNVVAKVRRFLLSNGYCDKSVKVGHMGTLDPGGTGVLPIAVGKATRLFSYFSDKVKRYVAEFTFGVETDTLDSYGAVISQGPVPDAESIREAVKKLEGTYPQLPPKYSAKSINGVRAYDLARSGADFELKPAIITVYRAEILKLSEGKVVVDVTCSAGTYIRSLARDLALELGTVAYMSYIIRTESGKFALDTAVALDELSLDKLLPVDYALDLPKVSDITGSELRYMKNGLPRISNREDGLYYVLEEGNILGIAEQKEGYLGFVTRLD